MTDRQRDADQALPHQCRWPIKSAVNKASASDSLKLLLRLSADKLYSPEDKLSLTVLWEGLREQAPLCACVHECIRVRSPPRLLLAAAGVPALQMEM